MSCDFCNYLELIRYDKSILPFLSQACSILGETLNSLIVLTNLLFLKRGLWKIQTIQAGLNTLLIISQSKKMLHPSRQGLQILIALWSRLLTKKSDKCLRLNGYQMPDVAGLFWMSRPDTNGTPAHLVTQHKAPHKASED